VLGLSSMSLAAAAAPRRAAFSSAQWVLIALMVGLSALSYFDRTIISIAGPTIMKEFHISETAMGTVYSAFLLSYTVLMSVGGTLADRFGARMVLTIGGLAAALTTGLTALCGVPGLGSIFGVVPSFLLLRLLFGVGTAPLYPSTARISADWIPTTAQGWVQAVIMAGSALGAAVSPILFSRLIAAYGWRVSFWIAGAATAVLIGAWFFCVRDNPTGPDLSRRPSLSLRQWLRLLQNRNLLLLTIGYVLLDYFEYIFFYWMYYYLGQVRHLSERDAAIATTVLFLTMAVVMPFGGWASDRLVAARGQKFGRRIVPMVSMAAGAVLLYLGASGFGVVATVALLSLALGASTCAEGPFWAATIEISGSQPGAACGILNTGGNLGGMIAPVLTPLIATRYGWEGGLYFASFLVMLSVLTWFFIDPSKKISE
ncbi:MAG TPA: MFS transporter, partial [Bryobacterales bacterium]|nr:MFS transporter [Bryobacterales bacterium]